MWLTKKQPTDGVSAHTWASCHFGLGVRLIPQKQQATGKFLFWDFFSAGDLPTPHQRRKGPNNNIPLLPLWWPTLKPSFYLLRWNAHTKRRSTAKARLNALPPPEARLFMCKLASATLKFIGLVQTSKYIWFKTTHVAQSASELMGRGDHKICAASSA